MPRQSRPSTGIRVGFASLAAVVLVALAGCAPAAPSAPVTLRLQVGLTPEELASFRPALEALDAANPGWTVVLEEIPQGAEIERITTQLAGGDLPDVLRVTGANVQQWIRRDAFLDLDDRIAAAGLDLADFYPGPLAQFTWNDAVWGVPDTASPEVVFYDRAAFADAGLAAPTADWTLDDMRTAALALTVDGAGRNPGDAGFDPATIERWGWNGGVTYFWQNALVQARGGELCGNEDCTQMSFTGPANEAAFAWWVGLVRDDHAALYDPYGGSQTGVPGDPFLSGSAAMGANGAFAIGQLDAAGTIDYGVLPPFLGTDGQRRTALSTNGYVVSADTEHPDEAWALVQALLDPTFLSSTWGAPGHAVPARRSATASVAGDADASVREAILAAMEVGEVFRPFTSGAFDAYGRTVDLFRSMNTGQLAIPDALAQIEAAANEALAADRAP
jgi:multiple sugar transport system substrate-binding protein